MYMCVAVYAYGIVSSAIWVFLGTSLSDPGRDFRRRMDAETSAKKTHLALETIPYAFAGTTLIKLSVYLQCSVRTKEQI